LPSAFPKEEAAAVVASVAAGFADPLAREQVVYVAVATIVTEVIMDGGPITEAIVVDMEVMDMEVMDMVGD
jgi:hypothetical protein